MREIQSRQIGKGQFCSWMVILISSLLGVLPAEAQERSPQPDSAPALPLLKGESQKSALSLGQGKTQRGNAETQPATTISQLKQQNRPAATVKEWIAQIEAATVQVTSVTLNRTDAELEIVLQTAEGKVLQVDATKFRTEENSLIADIPNAVLALPEGQEFVAENPTSDIATVRVVQQDVSNIRVSVTGNDALPKTEVTLRTNELAYILNPEDDEPDEEIVVTEERDIYRVPNATTATKTDIPIRDIPQSIQVVPRQVLEDQKVIQIGDALRNVSGISSSQPSLEPTGDASIIRGFSSFDYFYTNGIRNRGAGDLIQQETTNIERIEVLKGPASVLYGRGEPGGLINLVTKLPTAQPFLGVQGTIGNFDFYRPSIDLSGPLNADKTIGYRLNALYQNSDAFVDFVNIERVFIAPVFSVQLGKDTTLILEGSYLRDSRSRFPALPAMGTVLPNPFGRIPRSRNLGDPNAGKETGEAINIGYRLEHKENENLSVRNALRVELSELDRDEILFGGELREDNRTFDRFASKTRPITQAYTFVAEVLGKVNTGSIKHDLLLGL